MNSYLHLQPEERAVIMIEHGEGKSLRAIAARLGRSASTISRELQRQPPDEPYNAVAAGASYHRRRLRSVRTKKLEPDTRLFGTVHNMLLYRQWSPEQIANRLKLDYPDDPAMHVSHECIYSSLYAFPRNELKKLLIQELRQHKPKRGRKRSPNSQGAIQVSPEQTIAQRPSEIESREFPGHWEGDLIMGSNNQSCIGTLVERTTGYVVLCKMDGKNATTVRESFERQLKKIDQFLRLSMTYDRGSEMAEHPLMAKRLNLDVYFADPHSPWQRGSNENTNGLLRQYFPKGTDLCEHSQTKLNDVAWLLNTRPRQRHQWQSPQELMDEIIADHLNTVALEC